MMSEAQSDSGDIARANSLQNPRKRPRHTSLRLILVSRSSGESVVKMKQARAVDVWDVERLDGLKDKATNN